MANWDVIVIGLGGVGSAATYHLASAGHRVLGIDQYAPAHDRGSSHGKTRIIRQAYFEDPAYVPLLQRAYQLWGDLETKSNTKLFEKTGLVELGPIDGVVIPGVLRSAEQHDLEIEKITPAEATQRWPGIRGDGDWQAIIELNAGFLRVEDCVLAHQRLATQSGATCVYGSAVHRWRSEGSGVAVETVDGIERADRLVIAGGPWSNGLLADLGLHLQVLRKHQYWYQTDRERFDIASGFPCFFHETSSGYFYGFPSIDGSGVKVARHSGGQPLRQPEPVHREDEHDRSMVEDYVARYLPGVSNRLVRQAGCYYTTTHDEHFVVDHHPEHGQVTIVAGLSGHGFKFTSVLGEIAAQLAMGSTTLDIDLFAIARAGLAANE